MQSIKYPKLFSPVRIGRLEIKNRVAMTAMGVNLEAAGGGVNDDVIAFYEARARGGIGLIVSGVCRVMDGPGAGAPCQLAARNWSDLQGLARLADAVHKYGTRIFIQLHHPGATYGLGSEQPVAASAVESLLGGQRTPRALSVAEIHEIQAAFVHGARIAQMAGVDGVELHGAHGYLINSFLSPHLNHRDDLYGGNLENRLRFLLEIVARIRAACGNAFPLGVRLSVEEFLGDQGNDLGASSRIAAELETSGVDFIDVSCTCFTPDSPNFAACIEPRDLPAGMEEVHGRRDQAARERSGSRGREYQGAGCGGGDPRRGLLRSRGCRPRPPRRSGMVQQGEGRQRGHDPQVHRLSRVLR
jgi:2,4-dienoyl-CoA reductase-like NADH-dependent reductase (Old Yellow Enzyme family)